MRPDLSVIVPTIGRPFLEHTLRSMLLQQTTLTWEVVLVGDGHGKKWDEQLNNVPGILDRSYHAFPAHYRDQPVLRYWEHDGGQHCTGMPQRQFGMTVARGRWLAFMDDDNVYLPFAFQAIKCGILDAEERGSEENRYPPVLLYRWIRPPAFNRGIFWDRPTLHSSIEQGPGHIDAKNIVCPNAPEQLGKWGMRYTGDYDFVKETIALHEGNVIFRPEILALAEPTLEEDWTCLR